MATRCPLDAREATEKLRDFFREKPFVVFGTGMSCALDENYGMTALRESLSVDVPDRMTSESQRTQWADVHGALEQGSDLESALDSVTDQGLLEAVTCATGEFIASLDAEHTCRVANGDCEWPPVRLFERLVASLPEGDRKLHVLTPNYDLLLEHACDRAGIPYTNGFAGGIARQLDWRSAGYGLLVPEKTAVRGRLKTVHKSRKHIRLYKVHGSLNYFFYGGCVVENNSWIWNPPQYAPRVLITPGLSKYQTLQRYRQELLQSADQAINGSSRFLFLGYGFGDSHLEEYINRKLVSQGCHGLVITRTPGPKVEDLLKVAANLWLVCKAGDATRIVNREYENELLLPDCRLWDVREFTSRILGG
jgi:hypothetical protein